jgi:ABC-type Na+ transport system ATPase subunit NatA
MFISGLSPTKELIQVRKQMGILFGRLTARENIIFFAQLLNVPKKVYLNKIEQFGI